MQIAGRDRGQDLAGKAAGEPLQIVWQPTFYNIAGFDRAKLLPCSPAEFYRLPSVCAAQSTLENDLEWIRITNGGSQHTGHRLWHTLDRKVGAKVDT